MILVYLILILLAGGLIVLFTAKWNPTLTRLISLAAVLTDFILVLTLLPSVPFSGESGWMIDYRIGWMPSFGVSVHLALDGLSLLMLVLTFLIGLIAILISWNEINERVGFFHFNILWILAGIAGVFTSIDLFLFYFFWEVMLIPMYFLISIWGHENKIYASYKFFLFTQASGLIMFLAILGLYLVNGSNTGVYSFDYNVLLKTTMPVPLQAIFMAGFLIAFLVKLPAFPFHNWLPDAHTEAPTAGSLILASLMLKTGAYGIIRFAIPLFPDASRLFAPAGMILGVAGILYGAQLAFAQTDLKRLVAYTSVSHMGFVLLGVYTFNELAYQGVVMQMIAHGISTGALFVITGQLYERLHTRNLDKMGGLWEQMPGLGTMGIIFAMASLGLPGLGNFVAEFLTLAGAFQVNIVITSVASIGLVLATIYSLKILQKVFYGEKNTVKTIRDLSLRESFVLGILVIAILFTGLFPQPVINTAKPAIIKILDSDKNAGAETLDQQKTLSFVK